MLESLTEIILIFVTRKTTLALIVIEDEQMREQLMGQKQDNPANYIVEFVDGDSDGATDVDRDCMTYRMPGQLSDCGTPREESKYLSSFDPPLSVTSQSSISQGVCHFESAAAVHDTDTLEQSG